MRCFLFTAFVVSLSLAGCSSSSSKQAETNQKHLATDSGVPIAGIAFGDFIIGDPVSYKNLTLFPISSTEPKNEDRFITLDEGLAAGTVKIFEVGSDSNDGQQAGALDAATADNEGQQVPNTNALENQRPADQDEEDPFGNGVSGLAAEVNTLLVLNTSGKSLYLMPGEVISGGKQDRTIGEELVIPSGDKPVPIGVYCVEHGRWSGRSVGMTAQLLTDAPDDEAGHSLAFVVSQTQNIEELAEEAQRGRFVASVGQVSKGVRLAVQQAQDQGKVWEEVAKANALIGNETETGDFAAAYSEPIVLDKLRPYIEELTPVGDMCQIVGVAVSVNGRIISADWFESTPLFGKFWPKLLKSYALDAVAATEGDDGKADQSNSSTVEQCLAFLKEALEPQAHTKELADGQRVDRRESSRAISFSYYDADAARASGAEAKASGGFGFGGGFGGAVHAGAFGK